MDTIDSSSVDGVAERSGGTLPLLLQQQQQQPNDASYGTIFNSRDLRIPSWKETSSKSFK